MCTFRRVKIQEDPVPGLGQAFGFRGVGGGGGAQDSTPAPLASPPGVRNGFVAVIDVSWSSWDFRVQIPGHVRA